VTQDIELVLGTSNLIVAVMGFFTMELAVALFWASQTLFLSAN